MYLSGVNATTNGSLSMARNDVIRSAHLGSPGYTGQYRLDRQKWWSHYVIMRETLAHLWSFNQDGDSRRDNKFKNLKGATGGNKLTLFLAAIARQMQCECIKGALALNIVELWSYYTPSYAHHIHVDGINGSAGLCQLLTCENVLRNVTPSKV